jgi:hypothetical protein
VLAGVLIQARGWPVTAQRGESEAGTVQILLIVIDGKYRSTLLDDLSELAPEAFWTTQALRPGPTVAGPSFGTVSLRLTREGVIASS